MLKYVLVVSLFFIFSNCSNNNSVVTNPITGKRPNPGLFSKDAEKGISLSEILSSKNKEGDGINVNGFLWRASLNVLSIAPLISTDALGGTIITDWYINKNVKGQRLKISAFIKTTELRSDGISVKVHIQNFENEVWSDTFTNNELASKIEDKILNEARNLRLNAYK